MVGRRALIGSRFACAPVSVHDGPKISVTFDFVYGPESPTQQKFSARTVTPQITLPSDGSVFTWDWGDGTVETGLTSSPASHTYAGQGPFTITVRGSIRKIGGQLYSGEYRDWLYSPSVTGKTRKRLTSICISDSPSLDEIGYCAFLHSNVDGEPVAFATSGGNNVSSIGNFSMMSISNPSGTSPYGIGPSVSFPRLTSIGEYALSSNTSLTSVSIPSAISIGAGAFSQCRGLRSVYAPSCTFIGDGSFNGCSDLSDISFGHVTYIGSNAFSGCPKSMETGISSTGEFPIYTGDVVTLGYGAFYNAAIRPRETGGTLDIDFSSLSSVSGTTSSTPPFGGSGGFGARNVRFLYSESNRESLEACPLFAADPTLGAVNSTYEFI